MQKQDECHIRKYTIFKLSELSSITTPKNYGTLGNTLK